MVVGAGRLSASIRQCRNPSRRALLAGAAAAVALPRAGDAAQPFRFGLTPVFLTSDLQLLEALQHYLTVAMGVEVQLVLKRTYQEITSQLLSGLLDAAWICGFPFVAYRRELELVAVPIWRGKSTYQSYLLVSADREAANITDLRGDIHAFSDPDWMGFPPIATSAGNAASEGIGRLRRALIDMPSDQTGRSALSLLRLDGFALGDPALFDSIASRVELVRAFG